MALSAFDDELKRPREAALAATLGRTFGLWNELKTVIASEFDRVSEEWSYASRSTGWGLRLKRDKRVILYMTPCKGYFLASFAMGDKAVKAAHASDLPAAILATIDGAIQYTEGRGVRIAVKNTRDVHSVERLAAIKMSN